MIYFYPALYIGKAALVYGCKAWTIKKMADRAYSLYNSETDTIAVANGATAVLQGIDIVADFVAPPPVQFCAKTLVACADIGRMVYENRRADPNSSDTQTITTKSAFRLIEVLQKGSEELKVAIDLLEITALAAISIKEGAACYQNFRSMQTPAANTPPTNTAVVEPPNEERLDPFEEMTLEIKRASSIQDFTSIPKLFENDTVLREYVCPITKKTIRHICFVGNTYYEIQTILSWAHRFPQTKPRDWPEEINYDINELKISPYIQTKIDCRLETLFQEMKEELRRIST